MLIFFQKVIIREKPGIDFYRMAGGVIHQPGGLLGDQCSAPRGGVYKKVLYTMNLLHENGLIFDNRVCYTRKNMGLHLMNSLTCSLSTAAVVHGIFSGVQAMEAVRKFLSWTSGMMVNLQAGIFLHYFGANILMRDQGIYEF